MYERYGSRLFFINLVKNIEKIEREKILAKKYKQAVNCLNDQLPDVYEIKYAHYDMKNLLKRFLINWFSLFDNY